VRDYINALLWDATPEERAKFTRLAWRVTVTVCLFWAWGLFGPLGAQGFARADEIDTKIRAAVQPVATQLGAITTQLAQQDAVLREIRIDQLATKLRELKRVCCLAGSDPTSRARLEYEIDIAQRSYRELTGERYPLPDCDGQS
jgi:hypothetical protein